MRAWPIAMHLCSSNAAVASMSAHNHRTCHPSSLMALGIDMAKSSHNTEAFENSVLASRAFMPLEAKPLATRSMHSNVVVVVVVDVTVVVAFVSVCCVQSSTLDARSYDCVQNQPHSVRIRYDSRRMPANAPILDIPMKRLGAM